MNLFLVAQGSFPFRVKNKNQQTLNVKEDCCTKNIEKVICDIFQKQIFSLKQRINVNDRLIIMYKNNTSFVKFTHISHKKVSFSTDGNNYILIKETVNNQLIQNLFENKIQGIIMITNVSLTIKDMGHVV
ncbi:hypothetical protein HZS_4560 [Henneguya salminicola]|nr:hypothetical protein HZS_4560 [Henneguya salminicola]